MNIEGEVQPPPRRRRAVRRGLRVLAFPLVLVAGVLLFLGWMQGRTLPAPPWLTERLEARMNTALGTDAPMAVELGGISFTVDDRSIPRIAFRNVRLVGKNDKQLAFLRSVGARLGGRAFLGGRLELRRLYLSGATLAVVRDAGGELNLSFGAGGTASGHLGDLIDAVDRVFETPSLATLKQVEAEDLQLTFVDERAGRAMAATGGRLTLTQDADEITMRIAVALSSDGRAPADTTLTVVSDKDSPLASLTATVENVPAADLAAQSPAFAFLSVLDAPLSGSFRAVIGETARIATIDGAMQIGNGAVRPTDTARPIPFREGRAYFSYDNAENQIDFTEVYVRTEAVSLTAEGRAYLEGPNDDWPDSVVGQFQFEDAVIDPAELLVEPAAFTDGALDLRLNLRPFSLQVGQLVLTDVDNRRFLLDGEIFTDARGWHTALNASLSEIEHDRLLALWPLRLVPRTREWLSRNIRAGTLYDVSGAIRTKPEAPPQISVSYAFRDASVSFLRTVPPIEGGVGHSTINGDTYALVLDAGRVASPNGGQIDVAGTTFRIPNMRAEPASVEIGLRVTGDVPSTLSLLDLPPFEIMKKAGRTPDIAEGQVVAEADLGFQLGKRLRFADVDYSVEAELSALRSETLVPGRVLEADAMTLRADRRVVEIGGPGTLDGLPFDATWRRDQNPEPIGSSIDGTIELSQAFLDTFGIGLPPGSVSGNGVGVIEVELPPNGPPNYRLRSDLAQVGLRIAPLGWAKAAATPGQLLVEGTLGDSPSVNRLEVSGPGLTAQGRVDFGEVPGQFQARFQRVRVGGWLDAPIVLTGRGPGAAPAVALGGGSLDLRRATFPSGGGSSGAGGPMRLSLDTLVVSEDIRLTDVDGTLTPGQGLSGRLSARVAGAAPVSITLAPTANGTAIRVLSEDAGAVLAAAGVFRGARRGALDMSLRPLGADGYYDGVIRINSIRVRDAPTLAELLSALSIVGLLEQLDGEGMMFSDVEGRFRLTPEQLILLQSSAIGPSLGISLDGVYAFPTKTVDMQGVVSPIYMLNGVGSLVSRNREGLFGFNFNLRGPVGDPNVTVNPLSILTPGMFREIFRRPPPQLSQ